MTAFKVLREEGHLGLDNSPLVSESACVPVVVSV